MRLLRKKTGHFLQMLLRQRNLKRGHDRHSGNDWSPRCRFDRLLINRAETERCASGTFNDVDYDEFDRLEYQCINTYPNS